VHWTSIDRSRSAGKPVEEHAKTGKMSAIGIRCPKLVMIPIRPSKRSATGDTECWAADGVGLNRALAIAAALAMAMSESRTTLDQKRSRLA